MEIILVLVIYLAPTIIALARKRPKSGALIFLNLLLGWTVIGWIVALIMSFSTPKDRIALTAAHIPSAVEPLAAGETLIAKGAGGTMTFDGRDVTISRAGALSFLIHGLAGEKVIPIHSVQAVQLRKAGAGVRGYLQLSVLGGLEGRAGAISAASDENSVLFDVPEQAQFNRLAGVLREAIHKARTPYAAPPPPTSLAEELGKFAALRDSGAITDDEYEAQKRRILS